VRGNVVGGPSCEDADAHAEPPVSHRCIARSCVALLSHLSIRWLPWLSSDSIPIARSLAPASSIALRVHTKETSHDIHHSPLKQSQERVRRYLSWPTRHVSSLNLGGTVSNGPQGASPRELILEACRRNNTSLLEETINNVAASAKKAGKKPAEYVAETLNKAADGVGNGCLHVAATYGSCKPPFPSPETARHTWLMDISR
jgi:hypothetical protein